MEMIASRIAPVRVSAQQKAGNANTARPVASIRSNAIQQLSGLRRPELASLRAAKQTQGFSASRRTSIIRNAVSEETNKAWNDKAVSDRLAHLEAQSMESLKNAVEGFDHVVNPCALIAGDVVILELLNKLGYLKSGKVQVMYVDTFHLFPETNEFLKQKEEEYGFKAVVFQAEGCEDKAAYDKKYGADLWKENIEEYDRVCKVEPFGRGLKTLQCDAMINGRRRDHGEERAFIPVYEAFGGMGKINPLSYWTFEDCFDYLKANNIPYHPLHDQGYPSIGDAKDTVPVPKEKWFEYAGERSGRFTGLTNSDGSKKTECGIHVEGAEKTFDRDLWESGKSAVSEVSKESLSGGDSDMLVTVYAPWCQFCQAMEGSLEELAAGSPAVTVGKYRGDTERDFVKTLGVESFPTILYVPKEGAPVKYTGGEEKRDAASLAAFIAEQSSVTA